MHPYLNPEHTHPAYHCGRLLAVFARLQRAALGEPAYRLAQSTGKPMYDATMLISSKSSIS